MSDIGRKTAFVNARLIDPASGLDEKGALLVEGDSIADFGPDLFPNGVSADIRTVDCRGKVLAPGLVDMRVQLREPGDEHKETINSASDSAVAGGVTSMACLPNTKPPIDSMALVGFIERRSREINKVRIFPYAAVTKNLEGKELTEMGLLSSAGAVAFCDGIRAISDSRIMRQALSYARSFDLLVVQHAEDPSLSQGGVMNESEISTRLGLSGIPAMAEAIMIERDIRLLRTTGGRYHVAHISTHEGIDLIRKAKAEGLNVTCDTAPPYFALNELAVGDYRTYAKLSPPLRSEKDRQAVVAGLKDGTIDVIASDHAPQDHDSKRQPFAQAEIGSVGLETLLPISLELYHNKFLTLPQVLSKLTVGPADILGLPAGRLKSGEAADLVIFDPDAPWQIEAENLWSRSKNTVFDQRATQGRVLCTIMNGEVTFAASNFI